MCTKPHTGTTTQGHILCVGALFLKREKKRQTAPTTDSRAIRLQGSVYPRSKDRLTNKSRICRCFRFASIPHTASQLKWLGENLKWDRERARWGGACGRIGENGGTQNQTQTSLLVICQKDFTYTILLAMCTPGRTWDGGEGGELSWKSGSLIFLNGRALIKRHGH